MAIYKNNVNCGLEDVEKVDQNENLEKKHVKPELEPLNAKNPEQELVPEQKIPPLWSQGIAVATVLLATLAAGLNQGYSAVLLPQLMKNDSSIEIDWATGSWIASITTLPTVFASFLGGYAMERFGRKNLYIMLSIPFTLGFILISLANTLVVLLIGRFLTGISSGIVSTVTPVYIGEISDPVYRASFLACRPTMLANGILLAHILGTFIHWKIVAIILASVPILCLMLILFIPETAPWLLMKGESAKAIRSFRWFRGYSEPANKELQSLIEQVDDNKSRDGDNATFKQKLSVITTASVIKPLAVIMLFRFTIQFSGITATRYYIVNIFKNTLSGGFNEYAATIVTDVVRVVMSIVGCFINRYWGRRKLCFVTGVLTSLSCLVIALYSFLITGSDQGSHLYWIPLVSMIVYTCATSVGFGTLPNIMAGELFPLEARGFCSSVNTSFGSLISFIAVKLLPDMFIYMGTSGVFCLYGTVAMFGTIILLFILPETKGKTLQEIEEIFAK